MIAEAVNLSTPDGANVKKANEKYSVASHAQSMKPQELHIFDFDGTLFRSPCPNPALYDSGTLNMITQPTSVNGFGWFQNLATLSPPFVPESPPADDRHFIQEIIAQFHQCKQSGFPIAVMTGRHEAFRPRVQHLLSCAHLTANEVHLKPTETFGTVRYKATTILDMIGRHHPAKVVYYEDRLDQGRRIENAVQYLLGSPVDLKYRPRQLRVDNLFLNRLPQIPTFQIVYVGVPSDTILDPEIESLLMNVLKGMAHPKVAEKKRARSDPLQEPGSCPDFK